MTKTDIQKELLKSKVRADFSHYCAGNLYYKVVISEGAFEFPIATVDNRHAVPNSSGFEDMEGNVETYEVVELSADLGTTRFDANQPASMLWRWIGKAIDAGEFVKIG